MTSAVKYPNNFSTNRSQIIKSSNTCRTLSRPSTGSNVNKIRSSATTKRAQHIYKTRNEIERWAYNDDKIEVGYESDEIKSIDDNYLDRIVDKDFDEVVLDKRTMEMKQNLIHGMLKKIRDDKKFVIEMTRKDPDFVFELDVCGTCIKYI